MKFIYEDRCPPKKDILSFVTFISNRVSFFEPAVEREVLKNMLINVLINIIRCDDLDLAYFALVYERVIEYCDGKNFSHDKYTSWLNIVAILYVAQAIVHDEPLKNETWDTVVNHYLYLTQYMVNENITRSLMEQVSYSIAKNVSVVATNDELLEVYAKYTKNSFRDKVNGT